jgi:hypothetical protein
MKRCIVLLALGFALPAFVQATDIFAGFELGLRTVNSSDIKDVYGNGTCCFPYVALNPWRGLIVGAGYEFGYSRSGKIGIYEEDTTLEVSGFEVFAGYQFPLEWMTPYVLAGYGSFSYKQTVDSPAAKDVNATHGTLFFAGGARFHPLKGIKGLFLSGELKIVPLKVQPYDEEVDLGGMRLTIGLGCTFGLSKT